MSRLWPGMVFGLIGTNVCVVGATLYFAYTDPSFAVEPDYYQKALAWDATVRQDDENRRLGWSFSLEQTGGDSAFELRLIDGDSDPVTGAAVSVTAFHNARATERLTRIAREAEPGVYRLDLPITRGGLWEFRAAATRGDETFTGVVRRDLRPPAGGPS